MRLDLTIFLTCAVALVSTANSVAHDKGLNAPVTMNDLCDAQLGAGTAVVILDSKRRTDVSEPLKQIVGRRFCAPTITSDDDWDVGPISRRKPPILIVHFHTFVKYDSQVEPTLAELQSAEQRLLKGLAEFHNESRASRIIVYSSSFWNGQSEDNRFKDAGVALSPTNHGPDYQEVISRVRLLSWPRKPLPADERRLQNAVGEELAIWLLTTEERRSEELAKNGDGKDRQNTNARTPVKPETNMSPVTLKDVAAILGPLIATVSLFLNVYLFRTRRPIISKVEDVRISLRRMLEEFDSRLLSTPAFMEVWSQGFELLAEIRRASSTCNIVMQASPSRIVPQQIARDVNDLHHAVVSLYELQDSWHRFSKGEKFVAEDSAWTDKPHAIRRLEGLKDTWNRVRDRLQAYLVKVSG